jgi:membrane protease YdiL (CAAX protease family)
MTLREVFTGPQGLRAGWRILQFLALYELFEVITQTILLRFISLTPHNPIAPHLALFREGGEVLSVLLATSIMACLEQRSVLWASGALVFDGLSLTGVATLRYAALWGLAFLLVGILEESLLRGYLQYTLARGIGFGPAAFLLSFAFALQHTANHGESLLGLVTVFLAGIVFCLSLWYTKSLYWAVGFHTSWDWAQSYFYAEQRPRHAGPPVLRTPGRTHFIASSWRLCAFARAFFPVPRHPKLFPQPNQQHPQSEPNPPQILVIPCPQEPICKPRPPRTP